MSAVNSYQPHLFILPEDDANRELANGFHLHDAVIYNRMRILPPAGGWNHVVDGFYADLVPDLQIYPQRFILLLLDFDDVPNRFGEVSARIPSHVRDRVFVMGVSSEPEDLKPQLGSFESIGYRLAEDCREQTSDLWSHPLLRNNLPELNRLNLAVRPFLMRV